MGFGTPPLVGSSRTRDRTRVSCTGRWIRNHWTTRESPLVSLWTSHLLSLFDNQQPLWFPILLNSKTDVSGCPGSGPVGEILLGPLHPHSSLSYSQRSIMAWFYARTPHTNLARRWFCFYCQTTRVFVMRSFLKFFQQSLQQPQLAWPGKRQQRHLVVLLRTSQGCFSPFIRLGVHRTHWEFTISDIWIRPSVLLFNNLVHCSSFIKIKKNHKIHLQIQCGSNDLCVFRKLRPFHSKSAFAELTGLQYPRAT